MRHRRGIVSLAATVLLCLPSLTGGVALLLNLLLSGNMERWNETLSALVALGVFIGSPLVALAAVVGGITAWRRDVPREFKYGQAVVVGLATMTAFCLLFRFSR